MQALVTDINATAEFEPVRIKLEQAIAQAESMAVGGDIEAADKAAYIDGLKLELAEYNATADSDRPRITVGYIYPAKMTGIENARYAAIKRSQEKSNGQADPEEMLNAVADAMRETVRWGVVGCECFGNGFAYATQDASFKGRSCRVAADSVLDVLELNGLLPACNFAVLSHNRLSDSKKKK